MQAIAMFPASGLHYVGGLFPSLEAFSTRRDNHKKMTGAHPAPWPTPLMTSGARYSSVPTKELARASGTAIIMISSAGLTCVACRIRSKSQQPMPVTI